MDRLYLLHVFAGYANDAKTPQELYEAIEKLGGLPRFIGYTDGKGKRTELIEPAVEQARAIYAHARKVATWLRHSNPNLPPLPPTEADPFLGWQTIQEWCIGAPAAQQANVGEAEPNTICAKTKTCFWNLYEVTLKVIVDAVMERVWPK